MPEEKSATAPDCPYCGTQLIWMRVELDDGWLQCLSCTCMEPTFEPSRAIKKLLGPTLEMTLDCFERIVEEGQPIAIG